MFALLFSPPDKNIIPGKQQEKQIGVDVFLEREQNSQTDDVNVLTCFQTILQIKRFRHLLDLLFNFELSAGLWEPQLNCELKRKQFFLSVQTRAGHNHPGRRQGSKHTKFPGLGQFGHFWEKFVQILSNLLSDDRFWFLFFF